VSEREPSDHEPIRLNYRDPHRDGEQAVLVKLAGGCLLTLFVVWLSIFTSAVSFGMGRGAIVGGMSAISLFAAYAAVQHRRGKAKAFVAGIWIGSALGLLLTGFCSTVR
jgi:hypothetical protein